jgi:hypothetical protein
MLITHREQAALFEHGVGYTSDDETFALWLSTSFRAAQYTNAEAHRADLLAHGLTVDGVAPPAEPVAEEAAEAPEVKAPTPPNPHAYATLAAGDVVQLPDRSAAELTGDVHSAWDTVDE